MTTFDLPPPIVVVGAAGIAPAPTLVSLVQVGLYVVAVVVLPALTGHISLTVIRIYRAPILAGTWTLVDSVAPSPISTLNNLFDVDPSIGRQTYYVATVVNAVGGESAQSEALSIAALSS